MFLNVVHPLKSYLLGIGQTWWHKNLIPFPAGPLCGTHSDRQAGSRLKRFYVLFQAFPAHPTRAQWNARFKPLIDAAIRFDYWIVVTAGPYAEGSYPGQDLTWLRSVRNSPYGTNLQ